MAKNCLFGHLGSQNEFWSYPPPLIRRLIDCNNLVFFDNMTLENQARKKIKKLNWRSDSYQFEVDEFE